MLSDVFQKAWPYEFGLVYSVTLTRAALETTLQVRNEGSRTFDFQVLMHSYLKIHVCIGHLHPEGPGAPFIQVF